MIIVTGGAGFIGVSFVLGWLREVGWRPAETFDSGIRKTVRWYLDHQGWAGRLQSGAYREWVAKTYEER